ncbi:MAG: helix-turn-helix transcriptional regulator, partial [Treponema sp.]|nr:helix-turn-helix transcriptional regulator [Treponema sp.]
LEILFIFICVLLGNNRQRATVTAAFIFSTIYIAEVPVFYFLAALVLPLINIKDIYEAIAQFPQLYFIGLFCINIIITVSCLFAARWLRAVKSEPPSKLNLIFTLLFFLFPLIVMLWWNNVISILTIPFLPSALLGALLLGILILSFYLYTKFIVIFNVDKSSDNYIQFIPNLSKRELEVIEAILLGNDSYKKLASALNISTNTVKTHLKHIYQATGASNIHALSSLFRGYSPDHP